MTKVRRDGDWNDLFRSFDDDLDAMRERMERLMEAALRGTGENPLVYGFSMRSGPDGRPVVQEFGNLPRGGAPPDANCREPLTDVTEEGDKVRVTVELPGVDKQDIDLRTQDRELTISVDTERKRFCKSLELPCDVAPDGASAEYRNGVLTVIMDKTARPKGKKIDIN